MLRRKRTAAKHLNPPLLPPGEELWRMKTLERMTAQQIADVYHAKKSSVYHALARHRVRNGLPKLDPARK